jgi:O-antigen/teichoic acid export membrane protein
VLKRLHNAFLAGDRRFVALRGLSLLLALSFALLYSKQLGVERRGLLTFIMITNLVFSILFISGISLHLRNLTKKGDGEKYLGPYLFLIVVFSLITPLLNYLTLNLYKSLFSASIPNNLMYVSLLYCCLSTLSYGVHDALLLIKSLGVASFMDISTILIQIAGYFTLLYAGEISYFVSVLTSISISYLVFIFSCLVLLLYIYKPSFNISVDSLRALFKDSSSPYLINFASLILERIDKVFIGLQTSSGDLARYSTSQSIFGLTSFVPYAISTLTLARNRIYLSLAKVSYLHIGSMIVATLGFAWLVEIFIEFALGPEWLNSLSLLFFIAVVEVIRGFHKVLLANLTQQDKVNQLKTTTRIQLALGLLIQPIAVFLLGVVGSVIINIAILLFGIFVMRKYYEDKA